MESNQFYQLNPLIRLKEKELISKNTMEQLINAKDTNELIAILRSTSYEKYIESDFIEDFERIFNKNLIEIASEFNELLPDQHLLWFYTLPFTFHNLKVLTKSHFLNIDLEDLYLSDGVYSVDDLKSAFQSEDTNRIPSFLSNVVHEVTSYYQQSNKLQEIDIVYDRYLVEIQHKIVKQFNISELTDVMTTYIDLTNIAIVARGMMRNLNKNFIESVILDHGNIDKEALIFFIEKNMAMYIDYLQESDYKNILSLVIDGQHIDFMRLDVVLDNYITEKFEISKTLASGPLPFLSYLNAKMIEFKNLRLIIVGKRSGFTVDKIRERMREVVET